MKFSNRFLYFAVIVSMFVVAYQAMFNVDTTTKTLWMIAGSVTFLVTLAIDHVREYEANEAAARSQYLEKMRNTVAAVPDFPKAGIMFRDITPLLADGEMLRFAAAEVLNTAEGIDVVAGIESRGFVFAAAAAAVGKKGLLLLRKSGKLPPPVMTQEYDLEYGKDSLQLKPGSFKSGSHVLLVDDVVATGGTALAAAKLLKEAGAGKVTVACLIDLPDLGGSSRLETEGLEVKSILKY